MLCNDKCTYCNKHCSWAWRLSKIIIGLWGHLVDAFGNCKLKREPACLHCSCACFKQCRISGIKRVCWNEALCQSFYSLIIFKITRHHIILFLVWRLCWMPLLFMDCDFLTLMPNSVFTPIVTLVSGHMCLGKVDPWRMYWRSDLTACCMPALTFLWSSVVPCHIPECKAYMGTGRRLARTCNIHMVVGLNWISVWSFWPTLKCYYCVHTCTNRSHQREKMNQSYRLQTSQ